jgi:ParB-like chromosome segregation protein Spo0J
MTREISIAELHAHPMNSNRMTAEQLRKLERHIDRTGCYEPLVVRPLGGSGGAKEAAQARHRGAPAGAAAPQGYQILNGHHRLEVLKRLGHKTVRCEVWEVDDREALLLLATLNRLEGRDDPDRRALLLARLADGAADLRRLTQMLPEDSAALAKALALAREPLPAPRPPGAQPALYRPMTFFLTDEEHEVVERALGRARSELGGSGQDAGGAAGEGTPGASVRAAGGRGRAAALVRLARSFLDPVERS